MFARTEELARWGVLAPPLARLQAELLGPTGDVLLEVEEVAAAALSHRECAAASGVSGTSGVGAAP
ncbi:MAG: hypothetical protein ACRDOU_17090 [Streptosporangiaceae bacterium]